MKHLVLHMTLDRLDIVHCKNNKSYINLNRPIRPAGLFLTVYSMRLKTGSTFEYFLHSKPGGMYIAGSALQWQNDGPAHTDY